MTELVVPDLGEKYRFLLWLDSYQGNYQIEVVLQKRRLSWPLRNPVWERTKREICNLEPALATDDELIEGINRMIKKVSKGLEQNQKDAVAAERIWKMLAEFNKAQMAAKPGKSLDHL